MTTLTDTKLHDGFGTEHAWGTRELILHESVTRPHADGVVTNNNDPDTMAVARGDGTGGNAKNALGTPSGGEVIGDFSSDVTNGTTGAVGDTRLTDISDGTSNTLAFGRTDGSAASNVIESTAVQYTMFDGDGDGLLLGGNGADRLVRQDDIMHSALRGSDVLDAGDLPVVLSNTSKNAANGPTGQENRDGDIENIDPFVGMVVLDVGDVLIDADADDDGNHPVQTRTAGGSTSLQADPDGQANGIIAILIGLSTDNQGPLDNGSPALD
jgi:hypothetical protein